MLFYVFSVPFLIMFFSCFVFLLFIDFGTLNLQNAASYTGKTDSYLKLRFPKEIEQIIISGSILASFCHHVSCFLVTDFGMFFGMVFL